MEYYVYYSVGGYDYIIGLEKFEDEKNAILFIETKCKEYPDSTIDDFKLIRGTERQLETFNFITKVRVK